MICRSSSSNTTLININDLVVLSKYSLVAISLGNLPGSRRSGFRMAFSASAFSISLAKKFDSACGLNRIGFISHLLQWLPGYISRLESQHMKPRSSVRIAVGSILTVNEFGTELTEFTEWKAESWKLRIESNSFW